MRILAAIASYGTANDVYLARLIEEYRSMSHQVDIVVLSNIEKDWIGGAEVRVGLPTSDPWSLPFAHKQVLAERVEDYDLFIYSEDDTLITEKNISAFLDVSPMMSEREILGFLRYELTPDNQVNYPESHWHFHWDPESVRRRGKHVFAFFTCEHAACFVLTKQQLRKAIASGGFLVPPHRGKYDLACTASTDPYTQCGFEKLICISNIDDFLVHHLPNKYVGTRFGIGDMEFRRQLRVLLKVGENGRTLGRLFPTETALRDCEYSKDYYEAVSNDVLSAIPKGIQDVLSVGCGSGNTEASLVQRGARVVGVPVDVVISGAAKARGISVLDGDLESALECLAGETFDCLLFQNVLHLLPDPDQILRSYGRLLSKNGLAIVLVPNLSSLSSMWRATRTGEMFKRLRGYENTGVQFTHMGLLRRWFESTGIRIEALRTIGPSLRFGSVPYIGQFLDSQFIVIGRKQ